MPEDISARARRYLRPRPQISLSPGLINSANGFKFSAF